MDKGARAARNMVVSNVFDAWADEVDRLDADIRDETATVLARLEDCRSPMEVLSVERVWLSIRSRAYWASSLRFAEAFSRAARALYAEQPKV